MNVSFLLTYGANTCTEGFNKCHPLVTTSQDLGRLDCLMTDGLSIYQERRVGRQSYEVESGDNGGHVTSFTLLLTQSSVSPSFFI